MARSPQAFRGDRRPDDQRSPGTERDPSERPSVLLVDDHLLFAEVIGSILDRQGGYDVTRVTSEDEAVRFVQGHRPMLVLTPLRFLDPSSGDGLAIAERVLSAAPETIVIGIEASDDAEAVARAPEMGFRGIVTRNDPAVVFLRSIDDLVRGRQRVARRPPEPRAASRSAGPTEDGYLIQHLTDRESEVLGLLVQGLDGRGIADRLGISDNTVRSHVQSIFHKLHVHSRLEAAAYAVKSGMFGAPASDQRSQTA